MVKEDPDSRRIMMSAWNAAGQLGSAMDVMNK